jgi:hypothetical protein
MAVMAKWRDKTWEVSPSKVMALQNLSTSYKLKAEQNTDVEGSPATNERGMELVPLSLDMTLHAALGVDILAELESWRQRIRLSGPFLLAGRQLGPTMQLQQVDLSNVQLDDLGRIRVATIALSFEEIVDTGSTIPATSTSALSVGASDAEKADKKPASSVNESSAQGIKVGSKVRVASGARTYTGQTLKSFVFKTTYDVIEVKGDRVVIGLGKAVTAAMRMSDLSLT